MKRISGFGRIRWGAPAAAALLAGCLCGTVQAAGVTVITHGFNGNVTDWIIPLADRFPGHPDYDGDDFSCYQLSVTSDGAGGYRAAASWLGGTPPGSSSNGEILVKLDWSSLAGFVGGASSTEVAAAAAGAMLSTGLIPELGGRALAELPIHLIGHSRGGSVVTEMARLLGEQGLWVDQVTTLDPRPVSSFGDAAVATYENVLYADNFWQDMGDGLFVPNGQAIDGAYNRKLLNLEGGYSSSHSDVHLWYHGTIELTTPATDTGATINPNERDRWWAASEGRGADAGFRYSRIGRGDRLSIAEPAGPGTGSIRDGFNTHWDMGAGGAGNRTPLPSNAGLWPNVIRCGLTESTPQPDGVASFDLTLYYQSGPGEEGDATVSVLLDRDSNPWNDNQTETGQYSLANTGRSSVALSTVPVVVDPLVAPPGLYSVCVQIVDGPRTRYLYTSELLEIPPSSPPPLIQAGSFRMEGGLIRFTVLATPGQTVAIMASSDLALWEAIETRKMMEPTWEFSDVDTTSYPRRFYQLALVTDGPG